MSVLPTSLTALPHDRQLLAHYPDRRTLLRSPLMPLSSTRSWPCGCLEKRICLTVKLSHSILHVLEAAVPHANMPTPASLLLRWMADVILQPEASMFWGVKLFGSSADHASDCDSKAQHSNHSIHFEDSTQAGNEIMVSSGTWPIVTWLQQHSCLADHLRSGPPGDDIVLLLIRRVLRISGMLL